MTVSADFAARSSALFQEWAARFQALHALAEAVQQTLGRQHALWVGRYGKIKTEGRLSRWAGCAAALRLRDHARHPG